MSISGIKIEEQQNKFSKYPQEMDEYFQKRQVIIKVLPDDFLPEIEKRVKNFIVTSATQYIDYIEKEIAFWEENDKKEKLKSFSNISALKNAKSHFVNAQNHYINQSTPNSYGENSLSQSVSAISSGTVSSKTRLAKFLLKHLDENDNFFRGLKNGLVKNRAQSITATVSDVEGINCALSFRKYIKEIGTFANADLECLDDAITTANESYSQLNENYNIAFHEQEGRIQDIIKQTNDRFSQLNNDAIQYFKDKEKRCIELENLYQEKLKLQAPAEYWSEVEKDYHKQGVNWMTASVIFTLVIIAALILTLALVPNLFSEDSHWIDVLKNSAIITVVTSIAVYILRLFVKMTMSSFHLSRDAKERNKLTYFYLSLIERKAVTDKERAIILNSLFSRADTGLLKGDSSPTMSGNVTELVEALTKK